MHRIRHRLLAALLLGVLVGVLVPLGRHASALSHVLLGFVAAGLAFAVPLLVHLLRFDGAATRARVAGEDPGVAVSDLVVIVAALLSLAGVGVLLIGGNGTGDVRVLDPVLGIGTVAVGWLCIHTVYTVRYARLYYAVPAPPIDFNQREDPDFGDFAYFSFNLGMAYQVSDTAVRSSRLRRVILGHCLLAYVFGTVVIATTINLLAGLAGGGPSSGG